MKRLQLLGGGPMRGFVVDFCFMGQKGGGEVGGVSPVSILPMFDYDFFF